MPRQTKRRKFGSIELACEFSECTDKCCGMEQLSTHVSLHLSLMKEQLQSVIKSSGEDSDDVDNTQCECPWRNCGTVLSLAENWDHCARHINFHAYHTYIKSIGDEELRKRQIPIECERDFSQQNIIPDLPDAMVCKWNDCNYQVDNPWLFYKHVDSHAVNSFHDKMERKKCLWLSCNYCCVSSANVTKLRDHLRSHTQERQFACPRCGALYCSGSRLVDHQKREASGEKSFQCSHCSKKCASERILRDHLRKHVNMYGCMFCDMTCPSPSALRIHILYRHSTERPFACSSCDKLFKTKFDLATHELTHNFQGKEMACSVESCAFTCKNLTSLFKHTRELHGDCRIYGCHVCDELFVRSDLLSKHLRSAHDVKHPSGHVKFRFAQEADGIYRLVTVRYECFTEEDEEMDESFQNEQGSLLDQSNEESLPDIAEAENIGVGASTSSVSYHQL